MILALWDIPIPRAAKLAVTAAAIPNLLPVLPVLCSDKSAGAGIDASTPGFTAGSGAPGAAGAETVGPSESGSSWTSSRTAGDSAGAGFVSEGASAGLAGAVSGAALGAVDTVSGAVTGPAAGGAVSAETAGTGSAAGALVSAGVSGRG